VLKQTARHPGAAAPMPKVTAYTCRRSMPTSLGGPPVRPDRLDGQAEPGAGEEEGDQAGHGQPDRQGTEFSKKGIWTPTTLSERPV